MKLSSLIEEIGDHFSEEQITALRYGGRVEVDILDEDGVLSTFRRTSDGRWDLVIDLIPINVGREAISVARPRRMPSLK